jgi:hypothetical protein
MPAKNLLNIQKLYMVLKNSINRDVFNKNSTLVRAIVYYYRPTVFLLTQVNKDWTSLEELNTATRCAVAW